MSKWINIKDRLPPYQATIYIFNGKVFEGGFRNSFTKKFFVPCLGEIKNVTHWMLDSDHKERIDPVTGWMPLPEVPKEE
jgi:hypothetical protein